MTKSDAYNVDRIDKPISNIIDGILESARMLMNEQIRANLVVIDRKYIGALKPFIINYAGSPKVAQPMIGGLKVFFDVLPNDVAFLTMHSDNIPETELERLRAENAELKQKLLDVKIALGLDGDY